MSTNISSQRIQWIDIARGIAILLVVLGHCIGNLEDPVNRVILAFHMPLFFFLSGLCAKDTVEPINCFLKKKLLTLLVPQMTLGMLNTVFNGGG